MRIWHLRQSEAANIPAAAGAEEVALQGGDRREWEVREEATQKVSRVELQKFSRVVRDMPPQLPILFSFFFGANWTHKAHNLFHEKARLAVRAVGLPPNQYELINIFY